MLEVMRFVTIVASAYLMSRLLSLVPIDGRSVFRLANALRAHQQLQQGTQRF